MKMADDIVNQAKDPGGIEPPACGFISKLFSQCAAPPAPLSTNLNPNLNRDNMPETAKKAEQGGFGTYIEGAAKAIGERQRVLNDIMKP